MWCHLRIWLIRVWAFTRPRALAHTHTPAVCVCVIDVLKWGENEQSWADWRWSHHSPSPPSPSGPTFLPSTLWPVATARALISADTVREDLILDLLSLMGGQEAPTQCVTCEAGGAPRTEEEESVSEVTMSCPPSLKWVNDCSRWGETRPNRNTASTLPRYLTFILFLTVLVIYLFQTFWDNSTLLVLFLWTYLPLYLYTVSLPGSDRFLHRPRPHPCSPAQVPLLGFKLKDLSFIYFQYAVST